MEEALPPRHQWLDAILDNPIAVREWRVLWRRASNWRIWVGLKWPLDPLVWGAPVVLTYAIAPYGLWAVLALLRCLRLSGSGRIPVDAFSILVMVFWAYVAAICLVLAATAITHERQTQTWEQIRAATISRRERAVGFLLGRLGPVWASAMVTVAIWCLLQPSYAGLLSSLTEFQITRSGLALGTLFMLGFSVLGGEIGLLASARMTSAPVSVATAVTLSAPFFLLGAAFTYASLLMPTEFAQETWHDRLDGATVVFFMGGTVLMLCHVLWFMMENRLDAS